MFIHMSNTWSLCRQRLPHVPHEATINNKFIHKNCQQTLQSSSSRYSPQQMESSFLTKRPNKRRRTKGVRRLVEGDDALADGVQIKTTIQQTANGAVEEKIEVPIWKNKPNSEPTNIDETDEMPSEYNHMDDNDLPPSHDLSENTRPQSYYLQEFVNRVDPMLKALLSRQVLHKNTYCINCPKENIAVWRCKDCTASRMLCRGCIRDRHIECPTHRIETWTGSYFRRAELWEVGLYILIPHHTDTPICNSLKFQQEHLEHIQKGKDILEQNRLLKGLTAEDQVEEFMIEGCRGMNAERSCGEHHNTHNADIDMFEEDDEDDFTQFTNKLDSMYRKRHGDETDIKRDNDNNAAAYSYDIPAQSSEAEEQNIPSSAPIADAMNNRYLRLVDINGIHHIAIVYCTCRGMENTHSDLMAAALFPTSFSRYRTVFTHAVLDDFRLSNLECKASAYQYFQKLRRQTSPMSPDKVPDLYHELRRMSRLWRWMKKLKWSGVAHKNASITDIQPGELANFCPACPQPGINLPPDWPTDTQR